MPGVLGIPQGGGGRVPRLLVQRGREFWRCGRTVLAAWRFGASRSLGFASEGASGRHRKCFGLDAGAANEAARLRL